MNKTVGRFNKRAFWEQPFSFVFLGGHCEVCKKTEDIKNAKKVNFMISDPCIPTFENIAHVGPYDNFSVRLSFTS